MIKPKLLARSIKSLAFATLLTASVSEASILPNSAQTGILDQEQLNDSEELQLYEQIEKIEPTDLQIAATSNESDESDAATTINKPQEVPNFDAFLDATLEGFNNEEALQMIAQMIAKDAERQQIVVSYIKKIFKEPKLKTTLRQEMMPLLANSDYDLQDEEELASAVSESASNAAGAIICKGLNRLSDEQIQNFLSALTNTMKKWDATFLNKVKKANTDPQQGVYLITESIAPQDLNIVFDAIFQSFSAQLNDNPKAIDLSDKEKQEVVTAFITTIIKWYEDHQEIANKLMALALSEAAEEPSELNTDEAVLLIQSFVDLIDSYNSNDKQNVLLRRALVKSISDSASGKENSFSLF